MRILGLDVATCTGWAVSSGRTSNDIISGSIKGKGGDQYRIAGSLQDQLHRVIREIERPDLCVMEQPLGAAPNPTTLAKLNLYFGSLNAVCRGYGIPCLPVADSTWRNTMYGYGRKKGWSSKEWKKHAKFHCETVLKVDVKNADEAEAVIISQYGFYTQAFKKMVMDAEEKAA